MTSNELLDLIGTANSSYLLEAQSLMEGQAVSRKKMVWLIAAMISLMLLLLGCAWAILRYSSRF